MFLLRNRYQDIFKKFLTSTSKLACKGNFSSDRTYNHILIVLKDFMVLVNCCNQLNIRWQHCGIPVDLEGGQWYSILFETEPYKDRANNKVWEWVLKEIVFNASSCMEVYLIWLKNPKWIYKSISWGSTQNAMLTWNDKSL